MLTQVLHYFETLEQYPLQRLAILIGGMLIFWILEGAIPLYKFSFKKSRLAHAGINLVFTVIHLVIHSALALLIILLSDWCKANEFGLVYWAQANILFTIVITVLGLDFFGGWLVHIIEHKVPVLWRFHIIHHSDNHVDVTTGLRHHPGESVVRGLFFFLGIWATGAPMYAVMIFQTLLVFATAFTHANIKLPEPIDRMISFVLISPNMHKVHHHYKLPYTDSNYGAIFSIWDRILGTFSKLSVNRIKYGIDHSHYNDEDENLGKLMTRPFKKETAV